MTDGDFPVLEALEVPQGVSEPPMRVERHQDLSLEARRQRAERAMDQAFASGRYALFFFSVQGGRVVALRDIHDFPDGDFPKIVRQVQDEIAYSMTQRREAQSGLGIYQPPVDEDNG